MLALVGAVGRPSDVARRRPGQGESPRRWVDVVDVLFDLQGVDAGGGEGDALSESIPRDDVSEANLADVGEAGMQLDGVVLGAGRRPGMRR